MLIEDADKYNDYSLQLDGYEDFSIMDASNVIVSLHQCKSMKNQTNYDNEFTKMKAKLQELRDNNKVSTTVKCYFHCNREVKIEDESEILAYPFHTDMCSCGPGQIKSLILGEITNYKGDNSESETIYARLDSLVNKRVLDIQQEYFNTRRRLKEIARDLKQNIKFSAFQVILNGISFTLHQKDVLLTIRNEIVAGLQQRISEDTELDTSNVESFIDRFCVLNQDDLKDFLQRANPEDQLENTFKCYRIFTDGNRIKLLYRLIMDVPITEEKLIWKTNRSLQTPTTLGNEDDVQHISRRIYQNRGNLDSAWIYDWFVGRVEEHVEDIREAALDITDVATDDDEKDIFKMKKVGILTVKEKQDGTFD